jgi:auxin-responsive protein IAA
MVFDKELNLEATELRLGLPGSIKSNKRALPNYMDEEGGSKDSSNVSHVHKSDQEIASPPAK